MKMSTGLSYRDLSQMDRSIINRLQGGLPVCDEPYEQIAASLGIGQCELIGRLSKLLEEGFLSRFGPIYNPERLGGAVTLAALEVPQERFDEVAELVNRHDEVAHNYARAHQLNMWFVIATEALAQIDEVIGKIEAQTGLKVLNFPKQKEYLIGLRFDL